VRVAKGRLERSSLDWSVMPHCTFPYTAVYRSIDYLLEPFYLGRARQELRACARQAAYWAMTRACGTFAKYCAAFA
jgi:hypothetical protein